MSIKQNLPSRFQIGEKALFNPCYDCIPEDESDAPELISVIIVGVKFTESKIFYDCLDPAEPNLVHGVEEKELRVCSPFN